jgi:hypothetical protein
MVIAQFPNDIVKIMRSYLKDRTFRVRIKTSFSSTRRITAGVPQGSVLGPALFNLFINDVPNALNTLLRLYADDTAALSTSPSIKLIIKRLQDTINAISEWCNKWRIVMNPSKTVAIIFKPTNKKKFSTTDNLSFFGQVIPWSSEVKYLGVILDQKLNFSEHIKSRLQIANAMKMKLTNLLHNKKLSLKNKKLIYTAILRPTLLYASQIWLTTSPSNLAKLEAFQSKTARTITGAPAYVRNSIINRDLKLEKIRDYILRNARRFYMDPEKSGNRPLMEALTYDETCKQDYKLRPRHILYQEFNSEDDN